MVTERQLGAGSGAGAGAGEGWRLDATYGDGGRFVNDHHILVHVHYGDVVSGDGHLVSVTETRSLSQRARAHNIVPALAPCSPTQGDSLMASGGVRQVL